MVSEMGWDWARSGDVGKRELSLMPVAPGPPTTAQAAELGPGHFREAGGCDLERFASPPVICQGPLSLLFF